MNVWTNVVWIMLHTLICLGHVKINILLYELKCM